MHSFENEIDAQACNVLEGWLLGRRIGLGWIRLGGILVDIALDSFCHVGLASFMKIYLRLVGCAGSGGLFRTK